MVGFAKHTGHALTFKVLTWNSRRVLKRSLIRPVDEPNRLLDPDPPSQYPIIIRSRSDDAVPEGSDLLPTLPTIPAIDTDEIYEKLDQAIIKQRLEPRMEPFLPSIPEKEEHNDDADFTEGTSKNGELDWGLENGESPDEEPELVLPIGRSVLMPPQDDGQRFRAQILERMQDFNNDLDKERNENPTYRVLVGHDDGDKWEELVAYNDLVALVDGESESDGL